MELRAERHVRGEERREERLLPWGDSRQVSGYSKERASAMVSGTLELGRYTPVDQHHIKTLK